MGMLPDDICPEGFVGEFWLGPTGDHIYHFHRPSEEPGPYMDWRDPDPGFVCLFVRATNPVWHPVIISSVIAAFPGAEFYLGNGPKSDIKGFAEIPDNRRALVEKLRGLGTKRTLQITIDPYSTDRWLAKLALGFGALHLTPAFGTSEAAERLRTFLWTRDPEERANIPIPGTGFLDASSSLSDLAWPDGHVIALIPLGTALALHLSLFGRSATISVTEDARHWQDRISPSGLIYVVVPGLRRYAGPIPFPEYCAWKISGVPCRELDDLRNAVAALPPPPPFDLPQGGGTREPWEGIGTSPEPRKG